MESLNWEVSAWPKALVKLMKLRGISSSEEALARVSFDLQLLQNPLTLLGMQNAVDRLSLALRNQEKILIYGDFDLDGTGGVTILSEALKDFGYKNIFYFQPKRLGIGYGFHASVVEEFHKSHQVSLIVTCDVGITAFEACDRARELKIDTIVTDHHLPIDGKLPQATVLINPNSGICTSNLQDLCGSGVAFYLVRALKRKLLDEKLIESTQGNLKSLLDVLTIATVTDMVKLSGDNRQIVKAGLQVLSRTQRPGLKTLLEKLNLYGKDLTVTDIAMSIAPKLNALSRLEREVRPLDLYLSETIEIAESHVKTAFDYHKERKQLETRAWTEIRTQVLNQTRADFIWVYSKNFHRGIIGILASQIVEEYDRPTFVGAVTEEGSIVGSARKPNWDMRDLTVILGGSESQLLRFGGHAAASGFELIETNAESFRESLSDTYKAQKLEIAIPTQKFDFELELKEVDLVLAKMLQNLEPFGSGFLPPVFCLAGVELSGVRWLKEKYFKCEIVDPQSSAGVQIEAVWFDALKKYDKNYFTDLVGVNVYGVPKVNSFNGRDRIQFEIVDIQKPLLDVTYLNSKEVKTDEKSSPLIELGP